MTTTTRVPLGAVAVTLRGTARLRRRMNGNANRIDDCSGPRSFFQISTRPQIAITIFGTHIASHANQYGNTPAFATASDMYISTQ